MQNATNHELDLKHNCYMAYTVILTKYLMGYTKIRHHFIYQNQIIT